MYSAIGFLQIVLAAQNYRSPARRPLIGIDTGV
jgi:hypothetical protein